AIWIIFSTLAGPLFIHKMIVGSPGAATLISRTADTILGVGLPALVSSATSVWASLGRAGDLFSRDATTRAEQIPPGQATPPELITPSPWQPDSHDPTGDKEVHDILEKIRKE